MIWFIIPTYNNQRYIERCLRSVANQHGMFEWRAHIVDDASTDQSVAHIRGFLKSLPESIARCFTLHRNKENQKCPRNIAEAIDRLGAAPEDVIFLLDGDDFLPRGVVDTIHDVYLDDYIWLTYGSYAAYPDNKTTTRATNYPNHIVRNRAFRQWGCIAFNHPITFRKFLWDALRPEDLRDSDGNWFLSGYDQIIMLPMLELATPEHDYPHYTMLDQVLYYYNTVNPNSDVHHVTSEADQKVREVWSREPRPPLEHP